MKRYITLTGLLVVTMPLLAYEFSSSVKKIDANKASVTLTFTLKPGEYLYKEGFNMSVNNPHIKLSVPQPSIQAAPFFDEATKKDKEGYKGTVTFLVTVDKDPKADVSDALLHTHFSVSSLPAPQEKMVALPFKKSESALSAVGAKLASSGPSNSSAPAPTAPQAVPSLKPTVVPHMPACEPQQPSLLGSAVKKTINWVSVNAAHAKKYVTELFTSTGSRVIRFGAAFILGILLSLTPCIYPMIPITVGILQASGSTHAFKNFLLALSYTLGVSTTFALLGLVAALGSCVFGEVQGSPWIIIPLALLLLYFAFSMFDWVNLYIPKFLQPKTGKVKGGSPLSAYVFGVISGTIASPCLSPGLVLILNYVTNISVNHFAGYFEGFLLLFIFGIGSSLPLLIIGTFSSSVHLLPKAGMWMVEIKKLVGLMLIGMAFYHLSHLERFLPWHLFVWVIVVSFFALGIYYFASITAHDRTAMKRYKNIMGTLLIIGACLMLVQGQKALYDYLYPHHTVSAWTHDYAKAREAAQKENKLLFIDIGATYCAACKSLDNQIFTQEIIQNALNNFVQLKIESDVHIQAYEKVKALYGKYIEGFPTYLIVDPTKEIVLKKWSVEIDQLSLEGIVDELGKMHKESL